jgi:hypothetical protein
MPVCAAVLVALGATSARTASPRLERQEEAVLPAELRWAMDVRWAGDDRLVIAGGKRGVVETDLAGTVTRTVIPGGRAKNALWLASRVGWSPLLVAGGAPAFALVTATRDVPPALRTLAFDAVLDLDVFESSLLVLGARRDAAGQWAADGAMAWLERGGSGLRPVHFSAGGPGSDTVARCIAHQLGAVRFLGGGSFVVVPGVEPGVFWYAADGRLARAWQTDDLAIDAGCPFDERQSAEMAARPEPRWAWWNQHELVDDVVPLPNGPGLLVRRHVGRVTSWDLVVLQRDGRPAHAAVPVSSPSGLTYARGDVRGDRVVILLHESGHLDVPPAFAPRLVFLRIVQ